MWEAYELGNEDLLWAGTVFQGGIAGQQRAPCGAVSSAAVCLGLRHRCSLADKEKAGQARKAASEDAEELVRSFVERFGELTCLGLLGVELLDDNAVKQAVESGLMDGCDDQIQFVIEKLYELDEKRSVTKGP
jgi:C_GCAxxG_C_C family probable redox protein